MRTFVLSLPIILFAVFAAIVLMPHGFTVMNEEGHPWYSEYTSKIFPFLGMFFYPVTLLAKATGMELLGKLYLLASFIYSVLILMVVKIIWRSRNNASADA